MSETIMKSLSILICEADVRTLRRLESWVRTIGGKTYSFSDAIEALDIFAQKKPDIVIVSQRIDNMGSIEFIEKIKEINPAQAIVYMISSDLDALVFKRSIDLQVDKYLNIPVDPQMLFIALEALSKEKIWHDEFKMQKQLLQDYKDAIDLSFSVSRHDKDGNIIDVNDLFCISTGLRYQDAMKGILNPLNNPNEDMNVVWDALKTDLIYRDRQVFILDNNEERTLDITAVALRNDNDEVNEYLVFSDDVTALIRSAKKIKDQEIDKKLQKLEYTKEMNRVKDSFLTVFSHELKTPLNSIINFSEYIKKHLLKSEIKKKDILVEQIDQIHNSGWQMFEMIENLLDSIKLRDNSLGLNISEFSVLDTIKSVVEKYNSDGIQKETILSLGKDFVIENDKKRFAQILSNVISNAQKFSKSRFSIATKNDAESFIIEISDDGEGFSDTNNIFNLFSQGDEDNLKRTASGTGTGLFIVKKLCDIMHFDVKIGKSKQLGGAKVVITGNKEKQ